MGFSATAFPANRPFEMSQLINNGTNTRGMLHEREISEIFFDRHCNREASGDITLASMERLLDEKYWKGEDVTETACFG
jgi:hypothetical protein